MSSLLKGVHHQKKAVNLYSIKGFVTKELSISSFKYVVSDLYPVDIYRQNFEMIFRKLISFSFLSSP